MTENKFITTRRNKMKKAIVYVSDIILGRTGEIISRESQKKLIEQYAKENDIEITGWFEDEVYNEDVYSRPGFQRLLSCNKCCDMLLVERVWAISRKNSVLERVFDDIENRGLKFETATYLWDCASQFSRRRFCENLKKTRKIHTMVTSAEAGNVKIRRPQKLNFVVLKEKKA